MGPGHGGPGEPPGVVVAYAAAALQWGRATEGPESIEVIEHILLIRIASMGPGHGGPGEWELVWFGHTLGEASMGPGHGGPGEEAAGR